MSIAEIERLAADLKSNAALRAEAGKVQAGKSHATLVDRAVAFAASRGYAFTADDLKAYAKAKELSDADLVGVAGGVAGTTDADLVAEMMQRDQKDSSPSDGLREIERKNFNQLSDQVNRLLNSGS